MESRARREGRNMTRNKKMRKKWLIHKLLDKLYMQKVNS